MKAMGRFGRYPRAITKHEITGRVCAFFNKKLNNHRLQAGGFKLAD